MTLQSLGPAAAGDDVEREICRLAPWFHNLHLPSGHRTAADHPLGDFPALKWTQIAPHLPADLHGVRALDIGCNAGFYSFALAARGAEVLAIDSDRHYLDQARWAAEQLDPRGRVTFRQMQVYDLPDLGERFELILFLGVLYHLRHPLLALDIVAERTAGTLVLQTMTMPGGADGPPPEDLAIGERAQLRNGRWPHAAFVEQRLAGDPTNWWVPDDACVRAMARSAGLRITATPGPEIYLCEPDDRPSETTPLRSRELIAATRGRARGADAGHQHSGSGFEIARQVIPARLVDDALRLLHLDLITRGADVQELSQWLWGMHWFPHLVEDAAIVALADAFPAEWQTGTRCDPQILLQFPHVGPEPQVTFHVDREPEWAGERRYARIVGIPLSTWRRHNGGLLVEGENGEPTAIELDPGDAICMAPSLRHSGGINTTGTIRYGLYFRWLRPR